MTMFDVVMPQLGESLTEGTISEWLKAPGDKIARDEPLLDVSTDKVDTVVEAEFDGVIEEVLVAEGTTVPVGTVIARIRRSDIAAAPASAVDPTESASVPAAGDEPSGGHLGAAVEAVVVPAYSAAPPRAEGAHTAVRFSPAVLDMARRYRVSTTELASLAGALDKARPSPQDVVRYVADRSIGAIGDVAAQDAAPAAPSAPDSGAPTVTTGRAAPAKYLYQATDDDIVQRMSPRRRQIADHMVWSKTISAHASGFIEVDMSAVAAFLQTYRDRHLPSTGVRLTYTTAIASAAISALGSFPELNASVVDDTVVLKPYVNLGVAVAIRDNRELVVPVVHDAGSLSLVELARRLEDLVSRARSKRLEWADVQGGTFTFSNPGVIGGLAGTPVINQPQVAILGANAIVRRPMVLDDSDDIQIRPIMVLSLSFDHRIIDGALGFAFLNEVRTILEGWSPPLPEVGSGPRP